MIWNEKTREPTTLQWSTHVDWVDVETGEYISKKELNSYLQLSSEKFVQYDKKRIIITKFVRRDKQTRIEFDF